MLHFEYGSKRHTCVSNWAEIPLNKAVQVMEVINEFPEALKKMYELSGVESRADEYAKLQASLSDRQHYKEIPELYGKIITILSDVTENDIKQWGPIERNAFYIEYIFKFVYGLLVIPADYVAENITDFEHNGVRYFLPEGREIMGNEKPMANTSALEFAEVADLEIVAKEMQGGKYEVAANIVAILCRPLGEAYDEAEALERAKEFVNLPMHIIWEVFFYTLRLSTLSRQRALIYLLKDHLKAEKERLTEI